MGTAEYIELKGMELNAAMDKIRGGALSLQELEAQISALTLEFWANPHVLMLQYDLYLIQSRRGRAKALLRSITEGSPFFFPAWFELIQQSIEDSDKEKAAEYFIKAYKYADEEDKTKLEELCRLFFPGRDISKIIYEQNYKDFPLDGQGRPMLRRRIFDGRTEDSHFLNLYKTNLDIEAETSIRSLLKCEMLMGSFAEGEAEFLKQEGDVLAISPISKQMDLDISMPARTANKKNLPRNRFTYYHIPENGGIKLSAADKFFYRLFQPKKLPGKPKLVMFIFVDGLSFRFLEENGFEAVMPNLYRFFSGGFMAENCYAAGEWTLPSVTSMATGKYTANHGCFHTDWNYDTEKHSRMIQEYFHAAGYLTARICNNWRATPNHGYFKKNDRIVYAAMFDRMHADETVMEATEHLECFKDFHNFLWLTVEDLHDVSDNLSNSPLSGLREERLASNDIDAEIDISVFQTYSENKMNAYLAELKKVDFYLENLFHYIERTYQNDEILIVLNSDHGQGYLSPERTMFHEKRSAVPLLMRGRGIPKLRSKEMISNVDVLPTMLKLCGLEAAQDIDGKLIRDFGGEGRDFTYTESIFAGQTYKAAINDALHTFLFTTKEKTRNDGTVNLFRYKYQLLNRHTGEDESALYEQKVQFYQSVVYEHMKQRIW